MHFAADGRYGFVALRPCGCVLSTRALRGVGVGEADGRTVGRDCSSTGRAAAPASGVVTAAVGAGSRCPVCDRLFESTVPLNGTEEEVVTLRRAVAAAQEQQEQEKKKRKKSSKKEKKKRQLEGEQLAGGQLEGGQGNEHRKEAVSSSTGGLSESQKRLRSDSAAATGEGNA